MPRHVLMVIDMLKDFIDSNGTLNCGKNGRKIVPFVVEKVKEFMNQQEPIIFIMDAHSPEDPEFSRFPIHCVYGTPGASLIDELASLIEEYPFAIKVPKTRYSGFYRTNLSKILEDLNPVAVHIVGVCTNICVLYTVEELRNRDYRTIVYSKGVASFDEEAHLWALKQMETVLGAEIVE
ncbi:nicotinamidase/pyrazinamidase [Desulfofundulus australicus DSM 11792]|uniref:Nicotinamidase/pyrazinamidase n=1 Tax=Desulfofundulus australicus DSM 11792 TaxID=1121425 RepID=A0A1M5BUC5_9FIRM|nr:isochorismatase family cysteine hydrolase [Desulfofundulus australicus]SHF46163.1 nicotinamidase/pyrazinamidase [Desulfofundulus australicus DSM 11792]